jgi:hypothetical protein
LEGRTRESIEQALAIVKEFEILVAAWRVHATAWELYRHAKEQKLAETHRECAENCVLKIANSFAPEDPLCANFLAAVPVRQILSENSVAKSARQRESRRGAAS